MVGLLLGVAKRPGHAEAERRAAKATTAFLRLYPGSSALDSSLTAATALARR